ncbi:MAG: phosphate ABC transporter permease subunit PstC [Clostridiales bacterium]|nr:phosphate ABC transporter permease subunit PstC [Clostridiales bacterium]
MKNIKETGAKLIFMLAACISILAVALICVFLFANGVPGMAKIGIFKFISGKVWKPGNNIFGIFPMILGSLYITAGALIIGVPTGIITAIFISRFASARIAKIMRQAISLLAGIPSVVYGFFGLIVVVPLVRDLFDVSGTNILSASIILGIMILPTIIAISEPSLNAVPKSYYEGALALGATHERAVFRVILPAAKSGVAASIVLGVGRAIGEAMAVMMVAGNQARMPKGMLQGVRTLTSNIVMEMGYATDLHRDALIATAVVLFVFILLINILFSVLKRRTKV